MKKLHTLALVLVAMVQGCTVDKAEVAPNTPGILADVSIESAVKSIKGFVLEDYKALLLKPVDDNPETNLTTLFIADAKGKIWPVIENFEVKDVRVTTNGIYVLTNYAGIAFFVKYDNSWVELKDVDIFVGEDDNNNIVFRSGAILNTQTLQVDRSYVKENNYVLAVSGNVDIVEFFGISTVRNHVIHTEYTVSPISVFPGVASFKGTDFALIPPLGRLFSEYAFIDMKTGKKTDAKVVAGFWLGSDIIRLDDGSIVGMETTYSSSEMLGLVQLSVKQNNNGEIIADRIVRSSVSVPRDFFSSDLKGYLFGSNKYYILKEAEKVKVFDKSLVHKGDILNGLSNASLSLVDSIVYYSGEDMTGKIISGIFNLDTKQDFILDTTNLFTNIQPL